MEIDRPNKKTKKDRKKKKRSTGESNDKNKKDSNRKFTGKLVQPQSAGRKNNYTINFR